MTVATITENPQRSKERPHLPDNADDFNEVLWREIERGPDGVSATRLAQVVAETIARDYVISPGTQNHLIRFALEIHLAKILGSDDED